MKKHSDRRGKQTYFKDDLDKEFNLDSMRKYVNNKPEMDKLLDTLIAPYMKEGLPTVLDACCGIGHLSLSLHQQFPNASFLGIDETQYLIEEAQKNSKGEKGLKFETADILKLPTKFNKAFDTSICWKTLSWLPSYEDALLTLLRVTRSHIFISSLFYEGNIDYEIKVKEHGKEFGASGKFSRHNIYSLPRFERFVRENGAKKIHVHGFDIGIDLPRGDINIMGTYTVPLKNGKRLQMSGALPMPWKIIHIEL